VFPFQEVYRDPYIIKGSLGIPYTVVKGWPVGPWPWRVWKRDLLSSIVCRLASLQRKVSNLLTLSWRLSGYSSYRKSFLFPDIVPIIIKSVNRFTLGKVFLIMNGSKQGSVPFKGFLKVLQPQAQFRLLGLKDTFLCIAWTFSGFHTCTKASKDQYLNRVDFARINNGKIIGGHL
jgi:hypothetical protein